MKPETIVTEVNGFKRDLTLQVRYFAIEQAVKIVSTNDGNKKLIDMAAQIENFVLNGQIAKEPRPSEE